MSGYILAVDPGGMTGYAHMPLGDHWVPTDLKRGQLPAAEFVDTAAGWMMDEHTLLIYETFTITAATARKTPQPDALEIIGVLKFLARRSGAQIEGQMPTAAKNFVPDKQLRRLGIWTPGQDHARDATRHVVLGICSFRTGQQQQELLQSLA